MGLSIEYYILLIFIFKICEYIVLKVYYYWKISTTYQIGSYYTIEKKNWRLNKIGWLSTEFQFRNTNWLLIPNELLYKTYLIERLDNNCQFLF